ncbi:lipocalin family protein [Salinimicrobium sp. GXAS 041]|uniref:lipocalin family protein n=1 Tax=Salinimicrobium sp. GXAS 041 TaxID=3400806 RepID=UPI003C76E99F
MKKLLQRLLFGGLGVALLAACSAEGVNEEMSALNASSATMSSQDLSINDLVGEWKIVSMTSVAYEEHPAVAVDFNKDGNFTFDLMEESTCFNIMSFDFRSNGTVYTNQARLFFDNTTGKFECQGTGLYTAGYEISGNDLSVTFTADGIEYTQVKTIYRYSEDGAEYLTVTLTEQETDSAVYVNNDPGNTVASDIKKIEMVYKKQ